MTSKQPTTVFRAHSISCDLGVAACVVIDDKILLVKEAVGKHAGRWGAPKGYANSDEHPMQSALRELKEECGIDGAIKGIIAVRETIRSDIPALFIAYSIHPETTDVTIDHEEISDFGRWVRGGGRIPPVNSVPVHMFLCPPGAAGAARSPQKAARLDPCVAAPIP